MDIHHSKKIVVRQIGAPEPIFALDIYGYASLNTMYNILLTANNYDIHYILGILNSAFIRKFWLNNFADNKQLFPKIKGHQLEQLPIPIIPSIQQEKIAKKAQTMLDLNKELQATSANTDKHNSLKREIEKLDREINEAIYELYGLTNEEIKTVEREYYD